MVYISRKMALYQSGNKKGKLKLGYKFLKGGKIVKATSKRSKQVKRGGGKKDKSDLNELPYELLFEIAIGLDKSAVHKLCVTNKKMSEICKDKYFWKKWAISHSNRVTRLRNERKANMRNRMELQRRFKKLIVMGNPSIYDNFPWRQCDHLANHECDVECQTDCAGKDSGMRMARVKRKLTSNLIKAGFKTLKSRVDELEQNRRKYMVVW